MFVCRLQGVESELAAREQEVSELRAQLQREIQVEAQHAAGQAAELAGERAALQKQAATLEQERGSFNAWRKEVKEEAQRQIKVRCGSMSCWLAGQCCPAGQPRGTFCNVF